MKIWSFLVTYLRRIHVNIPLKAYFCSLFKYTNFLYFSMADFYLGLLKGPLK